MTDSLFSDGGTVSSVLRSLGRNPRMRVPQAEYAAFVSKAIDEGHPAFADAETGVGKTLGYLVPTALAAARSKSHRPLVVVSTATVALQKQLMTDDIPVAVEVVSRLTGRAPKAAFRVGRDQVVSSTKFAEAVARFAAPEDRGLANEMRSWISEKVSSGELPLRSDLMEHFSDKLDAIKPWLSPALIGMGDDMADDSHTLYVQALADCEEADILVVNHHLLTLNMFRNFLWEDGRRIFLVVDEADRLPGIVEEIGRRMVPLALLASRLRHLNGHEKAEEAVGELSEECTSHMDEAWHSQNGGVAHLRNLKAASREAVRLKIKTAAATLEALLARNADASTDPEIREAFAWVDHYKKSMETIASEIGEERGNALLYYSPVRSLPGIASVNSGAARSIAYRLWKDSKADMGSLLFTSATLGTMSTGGAGADAKRALVPFITECGFRSSDVDAKSCSIIAPNRFGKMDFVLPPIGAPRAFVASDDEDGHALSTDALSFWAEMIRSAAASGGRTLVLVPSHRDVKALEPLLSDLGERLFAQRADVPTPLAKARFLENERNVWLSATAWEGVSLPGAISQIVIPRLPIRPATLVDNVVERYFEEMGDASRGKSFVFAKRLAQSRRKLRQGIGRGIRSPDDAVTVWIGDARWPLRQPEIDEGLLDQPTSWSSTMVNAIPKRFRKKLETALRFEGNSMKNAA